MKHLNPDTVTTYLTRLVNASFAWTLDEQTAVATVVTRSAKRNVFLIDINGQEFMVRVTETAQEPR